MKNAHYLILIIIFCISGVQAYAQTCSPTLFADLKPGFDDSKPQNFTELNGLLYFSTLEGLWKTDGTTEGTILIYPTIFGKIKHITVLNNELIISTNKGLTTSTVQLWKSDGVSVTLLKEFPNSDGFYGIESLTPTSEFVFFTLDESNIRKKLWRTDGTEAGTMMVKDIDPTNNINYEPNPITLIALNDILYFKAGNTVAGNELWKSNGTPEGTSMVKDINSGLGQGVPGQRFAILNNELYFGGTPGGSAESHGLWKTDGTEAGTTFVKQCGMGGNLTNINGVLYFTAMVINNYGQNILYGYEPWVSDGTPSGTNMLKDIKPGTAGSTGNSDHYFKAINSKIVFVASDGEHGLEPWITDGTEAGTVMLKEINTVDYSSGVQLYYSKFFNGFLYFNADDGITGNELWRTDGTEAGTTLVADISPGSNDSYPNYFTVFNGNLFFNAENDEYGVELWSCGAGLSVPDIELEKNISIYPNPGKDLLYFSEKINEISVYDLSGKVVKIQKGITEKLNVNDLSNGIYVIKGTTEDGQKFNSKFIKN